MKRSVARHRLVECDGFSAQFCEREKDVAYLLVSEVQGYFVRFLRE
ncbi:MAG: hypothetical protein J6I53_11455 [Treponema sp.]|nr:hypothetical protein [Treponema sp.]